MPCSFLCSVFLPPPSPSAHTCTLSQPPPPFLWFAPQVDVRDAGVQYEGAEVPASWAGCTSLWFPVLSKSHGGRGGKHFPRPGTHTCAHKFSPPVELISETTFKLFEPKTINWNVLRHTLTCRKKEKKMAVVRNNNSLPFSWTLSRALHMTFTYTTLYSKYWRLFVLIYRKSTNCHPTHGCLIDIKVFWYLILPPSPVEVVFLRTFQNMEIYIVDCTRVLDHFLHWVSLRFRWLMNLTGNLKTPLLSLKILMRFG